MHYMCYFTLCHQPSMFGRGSFVDNFAVHEGIAIAIALGCGQHIGRGSTGEQPCCLTFGEA